jgi:hypothetical protein
MSNKQNLGYDGIKKMLNTMRNLNESVASTKKMISESEEIASPEEQDNQPQPEQQQDTDFIVVNDVEVKLHSSDKSDLVLSDEEKREIGQLIDNFRSQVSEIADFEEGFNVYPESIRLDGSISNLDLGFVYIAGNERGLYVNADMLVLNNETVEVLNKLNKFQHTYEDVVNGMMVTRKTN